MKGKGKGDRSEIKDCPLQFPDLSPVDHTRVCPRYTSVLQRSREDCVVPEDLDTLQTELEALVAAATKRMRLAEGQIQILNGMADAKSGKDKATKHLDTKVGKSQEERPSKKFKDSQGKAINTTPTRPKGKHVKVQEYEFSESPPKLEPAVPSGSQPSAPRVLKNDAPSRFWAMVEPYCADITQDDLKVLEDMMASCQDHGDLLKVPSLGRHYSEKWAIEDMAEEQKEGSKVGDRKRHSSGGKSSTDSATQLLKRFEDSDDDNSIFGTLTQRLVSALIEENIMTSMDENMELEAAEAASMSPTTLARHLNVSSSMQLECRIKRELIEQGLLDPSEPLEADDEVLEELQQKQQELKTVSQNNLVLLQRVMRLAKEEMQRQDMRKKMAAADAEVMEAYRKIQASKLKKKQPTKKEKDQAIKALREREAIVKTLEGMI